MLFGSLVIVVLLKDPSINGRKNAFADIDPQPTSFTRTPTVTPIMGMIVTPLTTVEPTPTEPPVATIIPILPTAIPTKEPVIPTNTPKPVLPTQPVANPSSNDGLSQLINQQRVNNNLTGYSASAISCEIADRRVVETLSNYSHTGLTYYVNLYGVGVGENLADGYPSNEAIINAWMSSADHRANILSTTWQHSCVRMVGSHIVAIFTT